MSIGLQAPRWGTDGGQSTGFERGHARIDSSTCVARPRPTTGLGSRETRPGCNRFGELAEAEIIAAMATVRGEAPAPRMGGPVRGHPSAEMLGTGPSRQPPHQSAL
jgi:hypothetical protein